MKSSVEQLDPTRVKISVEVPYAELKPSVDEAYKTIGAQVTVPGFRQGKIPARIIDQRIGRPTVIQEAINNGLDGFYRDAVEENDLKPLGQPEVEISEVPGLDGTEDGDLVFTVDVDVRPEITLPAYDSITVEVDPIEVTDADVENELEQLRSRFGTLTAVDRPAAKDDFVTLDLVAKIDDEEIDSASDISYQVGAGTMLEGMDEALEGLSAEESTTFETTFAGGEHEGESGAVTVTLKAVKERELPEADDDFAQLASEFDTIDELREDLKVQAGKQKEFAQGAEARDKVLEAIIAAVDVPVPAKIVADEVERHLESENRVDDDEHRAEVTEETERNLRTQFVLDAIAEAENVEVTQPELIEYLISASQQYGMNPNEFAQMLDNSGQVNALVGEVSRRKALAAALAGAVVKDTDGNVVDMEEFTTPAGDAEESADDAADDAEAPAADEQDDAEQK
ncbi:MULTISPECIES: trigger factor [Brevibacterium]|uniref:Trigger factor n=1 Tax=Brevibacterium casei TaxID=33889 RepID=A0A163AJ09_9MICO|nr:trigger factor [Brevibacterium casei]NJE67934.1 trigger factor [Brevibacterium sp. LS14]KZE20856.1 trigger factor [Brevibacterium casei]MBE4693597.1 trigger factor [Brevibacterium casei]MBY3576720.1 trigger factor [Brevibacterium casei]MCT2184624.1 trigger factor [Brevibacterium casei]